MTIRLRPVTNDDCGFLFDLLKDRTADQSISHKFMPEWDEHCAFVMSHPYFRWYVILSVDGTPTFAKEWNSVGSIYLTHNREVGLVIARSHRRSGYGRQALEVLMRRHPGRLFANVAPSNQPSHSFWESMGFRMIQATYLMEVSRASS